MLTKDVLTNKILNNLDITQVTTLVKRLLTFTIKSSCLYGLNAY